MEPLSPASGGRLRPRGHAVSRWHALIVPAHLALLIGLAAAPLARAAEPLTLPQAVEAALARSPALSAQDAAARSAREMAVAAGQRPDPVLRLSLENLPVEGPERFSTTRDFMTSKSVSLMQTFPSEDKRRARTARFEREADAARAERGVRSAAIQRETAMAWLERHVLEQRVALLQVQLDEARLLVQASEAAARGGGGALAGWIAARDAVAQLQQTLLAVEAERTNARHALARWAGGPPEQPLAAPPELAELPPAATGVSGRLAHHPELVQLAAREAAAAAEAEVARRERDPDWSTELMFGLRGPGYANMVSLAVSVPWQWDRPQRQDRELAARLARVDELRDEREERAREHQAETERWLVAWRAGLAQLALIDTGRLPLAEQRIQATLAAYRGGRAPLREVLAARRMALDLRMERIDLRLSTARLWARLTYLIPTENTVAATARPEQE